VAYPSSERRDGVDVTDRKTPPSTVEIPVVRPEESTTHIKEAEEAFFQELLEAYTYAVKTLFGGTNMYRLLCQRNPEFKLIVEAGIIAGYRQADGGKLGEAWQEAAWRMFRSMRI
jgi:hypothetical protein